MTLNLKILGIYREEKYSNRAIDADRAIMDSVLDVISISHGLNVSVNRIKPEEQIPFNLNGEYDLIFSMAQDEQVLSALDVLESKGVVVVNSSRAIRNCYREKLSQLLCDEAFSYPRFIPLEVKSDFNHNHFDALNGAHGFWVKRGDYHAIVDEDVVHIKNIEGLAPILSNFSKRGVDKVILQENCAGELFKFYGVKDSFFSLRHMGKTTTDRYVTVEGNPDFNFDRTRLEKLVHMAARVLDLDFFGGDCIVTESGKIHFIDFNDWPSFRTCRDVVAPYMASYALKKLNREVSLDQNVIQ